MRFKALSLAFLLASPAGSADRQVGDTTNTSGIGYEGTQRLNYVPGVYTDKREEDDPDFTRDPDRDDLISLVKHVADLIADRNLPQDSLPGMDLFMDNLQEEMKDGTDLPRYEILMNADSARGVMAAGYDELRFGLVPMIVAYEKLKTIDKGLKPVVQKNTAEDAPAIEEASQTLKPAAQAIQTDPPSAQGAPADASAVKKIQDQSRDLKPLKPLSEQAKEKLKDAKQRIAAVEALVPVLEQYGQKAGDLENKSQNSLADSRTSGGTRDVGRQMTSKKVIENAAKWMKKAVEKAKKVHKELEELAEPKEGLPKALGAAEAASAAAMGAKEALEQSEQAINQSMKQVDGPIHAAWEAAQEESEKQKQVAKAQEEKDKAEKSAESGEKAAQKAKKASADLKKASKKTADKLAKLREKFGNPDDADQLSNLPPMPIRVEQPKAVEPTGGRYRSNQNTRSKKLTYPRDLSRNVADVICDNYGERDCRDPGGSTIGRTAEDRSGLTGEFAGARAPGRAPTAAADVSVESERPGEGLVASARGIARVAAGSWQHAWTTGKQTLAGGERSPGAVPGAPPPERLAAIRPALVTAKNAEALVELEPERALRMAGESLAQMAVNPYAHFVQAKAYLQLRRFEEALGAVEAAITADGGRSALLLRTKAEILNRLGRYEEAVKAAQAAIRAEKEDAHGYAQASWGFAGMREYARSLAMMERASFFDSNYQPMLEAMKALRERGGMLALFEGEKGAVQAAQGARSAFFTFVKEGRESYSLAFAVAVCLVALGLGGILYDLNKDRLRRWFERLR